MLARSNRISGKELHSSCPTVRSRGKDREELFPKSSPIEHAGSGLSPSRMLVERSQALRKLCQRRLDEAERRNRRRTRSLSSLRMAFGSHSSMDSGCYEFAEPDQEEVFQSAESRNRFCNNVHEELQSAAETYTPRSRASSWSFECCDGLSDSHERVRMRGRRLQRLLDSLHEQLVSRWSHFTCISKTRKRRRLCEVFRYVPIWSLHEQSKFWRCRLLVMMK